MTAEYHKGERPPTWDVPPWELPGNVRLDCEPHRGPLLRWLANGSFLGVVASCFPCLTPLFGWLIKPGTWMLYPAFGLAAYSTLLSLAVWVLAAHDLLGMRRGRLGPNGAWETRFAKNRANLTFVLGVCATLLWGIPLAVRNGW